MPIYGPNPSTSSLAGAMAKVGATGTSRAAIRMKVLPVKSKNCDTGVSVETYGMLDSKCDSHLLSSKLSVDLGLTILQTADGRRQEIDTEVVNLEVCGLCEQRVYPLKGALVVDRLSIVSTIIPSNGDLLDHAHLIDLVFPEIDRKSVGLVIGICSPELLELKEMRRGGESQSWAGHSPLGWVLFGDNRHAVRTGNCTSAKLETKYNFVNLCTPADVELNELLRCQYALDWNENCYTEALAMSKEDDRALSKAKECCVVVDGNNEIWLPCKDNVVKLSNNYSLAEQPLRRLGNCLIRDPETH